MLWRDLDNGNKYLKVFIMRTGNQGPQIVSLCLTAVANMLCLVCSYAGATTLYHNIFLSIPMRVGAGNLKPNAVFNNKSAYLYMV